MNIWYNTNTTVLVFIWISSILFLISLLYPTILNPIQDPNLQLIIVSQSPSIHDGSLFCHCFMTFDEYWTVILQNVSHLGVCLMFSHG